MMKAGGCQFQPRGRENQIMRNQIVIAVFAVAAPLMGCATIMEGDTQEIAISVSPEDAQCFGWRGEQMVGVYRPLFQSMTVSKSKDDLLITCSAYGYNNARLRLTPSRSHWDVAGLNALDYATGALSHYDGAITIVMAKSAPQSGQSRLPQ
jgi:hypothetical protein